jgi:Bacterial transglutaminase-like N-terminal region
MPSLTIRHLTTYRYQQPVGFGEHRMMLRPRDSRDQRVIEASLEISLSISIEMGPQICMQKGPLFETGRNGSARQAELSDCAAWARAATLARECQARFLRRQLSLPVSTMSQWWVKRSSSALVILASIKTLGHSPKAKLVVTIIEVRS